MPDKIKLEGILSKGYGTIAKLVMKDKNLTIEAKAIYSYLCSYAGAGESAFPSVDLIVSDLNISENRFFKHRKCLIDKGYISIERNKTSNGWSNNIYTIHSEVHLQNVGIQNEGIQNVGIQNEGTNNNSFTNNNLNNNSTKKSSTKKTSGQKERFEKIWAHYPLKKGKENAFKSYQKAIKDGAKDLDILNGIKRYNQEIKLKGTKKEYIAYGSTWFSQRRWSDEYENDNNQQNQPTKLQKANEVDWDEIYGKNL